MPAITQYSRIQHRRGLITDLPSQLNASEIGHALDERRIFIGNGSLVEGAPVIGNTEIITDYTLLSNPLALQYFYRSNTPVEAETGPSANAPVLRGIAKKLDDYVSIKDYGAVGDGVTDDTVAINRALENLYCVEMPGPNNDQMAYRTLYFPAGVYLVSDYIYIPTHARLAGDGADATIIQMDNDTKTTVIKMADSLFQNGAALGTNSAVLPQDIYINGITFQNVDDANIFNLERVSNIHFHNCGFLGANIGSATGSSALYFDKIGSVYTHTNMSFMNCSFAFTDYAIFIDSNGEDANRISFDHCSFVNHNWGLYTDTPVSNIKISNSYFSAIAETAFLACTDAEDVSSSANTYQGSGGSEPVILFDTGSIRPSSINDKHINNVGANTMNLGSNALILNNSGNFIFQNINISPRSQTIALADDVTDQPTGIEFDSTEENVIFIDYSLFRGSNSRVGRIMISTTGLAAGTAFTDDSDESAATNITFSFSESSGIIGINYTADAGDSAVWHIQTKTWNINS